MQPNLHTGLVPAGEPYRLAGILIKPFLSTVQRMSDVVQIEIHAA
jgi:hypothetical protein